MRSIEGKRGEPRPRPPFPAVRRACGRSPRCSTTWRRWPTSPHHRHGADWFRSAGTEKSPGTKIFALSGKVNNVGLVEVDMGIPLGDIIYDIGGGIPGGKKFKAAQIGGPSGGCIPKQHLNMPVDYESVIELGAIMGSGGLIVMDEDSCMVDMARFFLEFTQDESCGKCPPCRVGTKRMLEIVTRICNGQGEEGDIEKLIELGETIKDTALCGLGQTAPNPVLSNIRYFRDEFEAHIRDHKCEAGVCAEHVQRPLQQRLPGVGERARLRQPHRREALRRSAAPPPGAQPVGRICARVCFHPCEGKCARGGLDEPLAIRSLKRFLTEQEKEPQLPEFVGERRERRKKIAVVGAGPSGLSCAYFLARLGYKPTVFEKEPSSGGMLLQAIPAYRLPREVLAARSA